MTTLEFFEDPARFLEHAQEHLVRDPVVSTVVASVAVRLREEDAAGVSWLPGVPRWFAVARGPGAQVCGVAMRTARGAPMPAYVLPMPAEAARSLARAVVDRGEPLTSVNGALPATRHVAEELARLVGGKVHVAMHSRLFELTTLVPPPIPPGRLRVAVAADVDLVRAWTRQFLADSDRQAGRPPGTTKDIAASSREDLLRRIAGSTYWLWEVDGSAVSMTGVNPPGLGVSRLGPVYTPPEHRGRGYAGAAVAEVSRRVLDAGLRVCLFTDQANPTSNRIYQRLGYQPVADMVNLEVG